MNNKWSSGLSSSSKFYKSANLNPWSKQRKWHKVGINYCRQLHWFMWEWVFVNKAPSNGNTLQLNVGRVGVFMAGSWLGTGWNLAGSQLAFGTKQQFSVAETVAEPKLALSLITDNFGTILIIELLFHLWHKWWTLSSYIFSYSPVGSSNIPVYFSSSKWQNHSVSAKTRSTVVKLRLKCHILNII